MGSKFRAFCQAMSDASRNEQPIERSRLERMIDESIAEMNSEISSEHRVDIKRTSYEEKLNRLAGYAKSEASRVNDMGEQGEWLFYSSAMTYIKTCENNYIKEAEDLKRANEELEEEKLWEREEREREDQKAYNQLKSIEENARALAYSEVRGEPTLDIRDVAHGLKEKYMDEARLDLTKQYFRETIKQQYAELKAQKGYFNSKQYRELLQEMKTLNQMLNTPHEQGKTKAEYQKELESLETQMKTVGLKASEYVDHSARNKSNATRDERSWIATKIGLNLSEKIFCKTDALGVEKDKNAPGVFGESIKEAFMKDLQHRRTLEKNKTPVVKDNVEKATVK